MRIRYFTVMFCVFCLCLCGCSYMEMITGIDRPTEEVDSGYVDAMSGEIEKNKGFYIMRVKDDYLEIPGECKNVYEGDVKYPELADGEIAYVTADVRICSGGDAGYHRNIFIDKIKSCENVEYSSVCQLLDIPNIYDSPYAFKVKMLSYNEGDKYYLCVMNRQYVEVYENGKPYMEYEYREYEEQHKSSREPLFERFPEQDN